MAEHMSTKDQTARSASIRETSAGATRDRLLSAAEALLRRGEHCTMRSVAAEAGVGERTIYRYFESRDVLERELLDVLASKAHVPLPDAASDLPEYVSQLFEMFEKNSDLIVGLTSLASGPLKMAFSRSRTKNLQDLERVLQEAYPDIGAHSIRAAAISTRTLLSGGSWVYMRISCDLSNEDVISSAQWAVRQCLESFSRLS